MISKFLDLLQSGLTGMREHSQFVFIAVLVFVFPLIFLYTTQTFLETAYTNIQTSEKQRVGILHDTLTGLLENTRQPDLSLISNLASSIESQNPDISEIRIVQKVQNGYLVILSLDEGKIGSYETSAEALSQTPSNNAQSYIYEFSKNDARHWQAIRHLELSDGREYFVFSEHSFEKLDRTMVTRKFAAYTTLVGIFLFLLALAYWLMRQIDWQYRYTEIKRTLDERDLFTNMIAHEFRTPLTAIKGYGSLLSDSRTLQSTDRDYLDKMLISSDRLLALINDFLEVARIQSGKMKLDIEKVDVRAVCAEVATALSPIAIEKNLELHPPEMGNPILLSSDKKRLYQVIQNLVSNAIKYTEKGFVNFSLEETAIDVTLRIKDTGAGISAEDQQKLFAPFSRVGNAEKSGITGTGLGMWITKNYVELLRGKITVESIKGVGTHVVVVFKR
jgi:nitrogen-specific signal transduction histidine kinase